MSKANTDRLEQRDERAVQTLLYYVQQMIDNGEITPDMTTGVVVIPANKQRALGYSVGRGTNEALFKRLNIYIPDPATGNIRYADGSIKVNLKAIGDKQITTGAKNFGKKAIGWAWNSALKGDPSGSITHNPSNIGY